MFSLTKEDEIKLDKWKKTLPPEESTAIGGVYTYSFTPTGIGTFIKVTRYDGYELDVTKDVDW